MDAVVGAEQKEQDMWDEVEGYAELDADTIVAGDMNAELGPALARGGRQPSEQDVRLQGLVERANLTHLSVGRATYRDTSEIDHVMASTRARQYLSEPEWRPGQNAGDHGGVWVKMRTRRKDEEEGKGDDRPKGVRGLERQRERRPAVQRAAGAARTLPPYMMSSWPTAMRLWPQRGGGGMPAEFSSTGSQM